MVKEIPVHKYGFLFLFRVSGKDIGGSQIRRDGEWLDIRYRQIAHHTPEPFTVEAVVGGHSEEGLRPFLQTPQIALLKISCRHSEVLDTLFACYTPEELLSLYRLMAKLHTGIQALSAQKKEAAPHA